MSKVHLHTHTYVRSYQDQNYLTNYKLQISKVDSKLHQYHALIRNNFLLRNNFINQEGYIINTKQKTLQTSQ